MTIAVVEKVTGHSLTDRNIRSYLNCQQLSPPLHHIGVGNLSQTSMYFYVIINCEWILFYFLYLPHCLAALCNTVGGCATCKSAFYFGVIIVIIYLLGRVSKELFFNVSSLQLTAHQITAFEGLLSHLKQIHKTDYANEKSITFQLLLVQDAKMKLDGNVIVGEILCFSFITGME